MTTPRHHTAKTPKAAASQKSGVERSTLRAKQPCFCYIVECQDGTFYTGWAVDAERRVKMHNAGRGARYTRTRRPVRLVYVEPQPDRTTAMKRELAIKRLTRARKQALISGRMPNAVRARRRKA